jgi:predicted ABC-type ATPase
LEKQDIAKHRIQVRTEFKGHFVNNKTIELKWNAGYENVNLHFRFFDNILIVDNSIQNDVYTNILQIEKGEIILMTEKLPGYFEERFPEISEMIKNL